MGMEIELKAWVKNPQELCLKLSDATVFIGNFEKRDIFFNHSNIITISERTGYGIRVRELTIIHQNEKKTETCLVTYKNKHVKDGIEINDEREFEVSSAEAFKDCLLYLGLMEKSRKIKKGSSYDNKGMTVELVEVEGLGWFIELEILLKTENYKNIEKEKERLLNFLDYLDIPRVSIESRSYTAMLIEKNQ